MIRWLQRTVLVGTALVLSGGATKAALLRSSFEGLVTARNSFSSAPAIGSTISGQWTVDPTILDGEGPNCVAVALCWSGPETSWTWNDLTFSPAGPPFLLVPFLYGIRHERVDVAPGTGSDILTVRLGGFSFTQITLTFTDPQGNAFESGSLGAFSSRQFTYLPLCLTGISCATNPTYSGVITSVSSQIVADPIPEPATLGSRMLGSLLLMRVRRRTLNSHRYSS